MHVTSPPKEGSPGFGDATTQATPSPLGELDSVRRFRLVVVDGPDKETTWDSSGDRCSIGVHPSNDLVMRDPTVSRFHCEVVIDARGARVRDLDSRNGTILDGVAVMEAFLRAGSMLKLGRSALRFELVNQRNVLPVSPHTQFGSLVGTSAAMRAAFTLLERAAETDATVLLEGETGTGKEGAAEAIHLASARRDRPFVVVDCGAMPENLIESELFGHERGAFTDARDRRIGAFEEASTGTIFLDEIGELPLSLQPKLLRVLEDRKVRRLGSNDVHSVDLRVIAATNRDLRGAINDGRFRPDLYFRLAVLKIRLPPLRNRPEDIPVLGQHILRSLGATPDTEAALLAPDFVARLQSTVWPGNVRELRNFLEQCLVFREQLPPGEPAAPPPPEHVDLRMSYAEARRRAIAEFERRYISALLRHHHGKVMPAARAAGINRVHLFRLTRRHGIKE